MAQYPVCEKTEKYERVAIAINVPKTSRIYQDKVVWYLNDGHTAESIDGIKPAYIGQILVQQFQMDTNRFVVDAKDAGNYPFEEGDYRFPTPFIICDRKVLYAGRENYIKVGNDDSSANLNLTCDAVTTKIVNLGGGRFVVTPGPTSADNIIEFTATATYGSAKTKLIHNYSTKVFYVAYAKPNPPILVVPKQGLVNKVVKVGLEIEGKDLTTILLTNNGVIEKKDEKKYEFTRNTQGVSKLYAFTIKGNQTSEYASVDLPIFQVCQDDKEENNG